VQHPTFTERYFPPPGNTAHACADSEATHTWFPWHLLTEQLGRCSSSHCDQPTAYLLAESGAPDRPGLTTCCLPACADHVCDLARTVNEHTQCPKCHCAWTQSEDGTHATKPAGITPDEVKRLRLEPDDTLIVRVRDSWTPNQIREYQDYLETVFPDNQVLVLPGEQVLTAGPGTVAEPPPDQNPDGPLGIVTLEWLKPSETRFPLVVPAELVVRDAQTGESLVGLTHLRLDVDMPKGELTVTTTEIGGESGKPIRQGNQHEREAPTADGRGVQTVTRRCVLAGSFNKIDIDVADIEWGAGHIVNDAAATPGIGHIGLCANGDTGDTLAAALSSGGTAVNVVNGALALDIENLDQRIGAVTAPSIPASGTPLTNPFWRQAEVTITGGTVTQIAVDGANKLITSGTVTVPSGRSITLTYSVAPTWSWTVVK
jgi:hypothetical protein